MSYETDAWEYIPARDFGAVRTETRLITIHDAEFPEQLKGARGVANYFKAPDKPSSAQICVDNQEVIQSVKDSRVAYAAPGANHDGVHVELVGYQSQTKGQWIDNYSLGVLVLGASAVAQYCLKYDIPAIHLSDGELKSGVKGIVGHEQVSRVYHKSDHTDPGPNFPWDLFISMVQEIRALRA